jgi:N-acetylated-alpha-linked acidic dipeptidase
MRASLKKVFKFSGKKRTMLKMNLYKITLLFVAGFASSLAAQPFHGYGAIQHERQARLERQLLELPNSEAFARHLERLTEAPHRAGSPENSRVADYIAEAMEKAGWAVERYPYDIYLPTGPGESSISLVTPVRMPLNNLEYIVPEDPYSSDSRIARGWNSFSGSGEVVAQVVYVNYGTKEDFEQLAKLGVSLEGKIALARYGGNFRGYKAKFAEAAGASGLIIFTDPMDAGYMKGLVYPEGTWFDESSIQRGSLLTLDWTGDPLTPFEPALPLDGPRQVERLDPSSVPFHTIPAAPIGYGAAKEILSRMKGRAVPSSWQGGLPFTYRLEGGEDLSVHLKVEQPRGFVRVQNVLGTLEGSEFPDEWIILGCHYDAWEFGASDPNSGTAMLLQVAEALGELARQGQRPRRTVKIAHWDAEEHGIIGAAEWVEQLREELDKKAVAYYNADAACSGLTFNAAASPSLKRLLVDAAKATPFPKGEKTLYEHWMERATDKAKGPNIGNLGGGSDHLPFYAHLGVPSLSAGMGGPTLYHTAYDNFHWYRTYADPEFLSGPTMTRFFGILALRMANADILPFDVERYAVDLETHLEAAKTKIAGYDSSFSPAPLLAAVKDLGAKAKAYDKAMREKLSGRLPASTALRSLNQELIALERAFIDPDGMAFGKWYRSLYAASDPYSGYGSWMLPGFLYEASLASSENLPVLTERYLQAINKLNRRVSMFSNWLK